MSDDHDQDDDSSAGDAAARASSEIAGGAAELLEGASELAPEEAAEALEVASTVAGAAKSAIDTGAALGRGDLGGAAGALGRGAGGVGQALGDSEAGQAVSGVGRAVGAVGAVARGAAELVEDGEDLLATLGGQPEDIEAELEIEGLDVLLRVTGFDLFELLGGCGNGHISATYGRTSYIERQALLAKNASLRIHRGDRMRHFRGVVRHAQTRTDADRNHELRIEVAPAFSLLEETRDSRIYQNLTVPALVQEVVGELLGGRQRTVRLELGETYEEHEYLVQHRESHLQFLSRLMLEEGIFFFFDHDSDDSDHEVLVLADSNSDRPPLFDGGENALEFTTRHEARRGHEVAFHADSDHRVGATDAAVRGFDWTAPALDVSHAHSDRGDFPGPALEVYDHDHSLRHSQYDDGGGSYRSHDAARRSRMHAERLDLSRSRWEVGTTAIGAVPGKVFELTGAGDHDGTFLIVQASARAHLSGSTGEYQNSLRVIPDDMPYRPPTQPRHLMPGPETATVVGPPGEEIHTDQHGRVKVQFHWDRRGERNEHSSAWIRVAQMWTGPGWGSIFIPRIGAEVIVTYMGGDPDRPVITGCLYNGDHRVPYTLPDEKTKSTIKTNSSPGGGGYNELRFEDKAGSEEIFTHAQKDYNEVVEHDHTTTVHNDQTNTVDGNQTETVKVDQAMTVHGERTKTVDKDETNTVHQNRTTRVDKNDEESVGGDRSLHVEGNETVTIDKDRKLHVIKKTIQLHDDGREVTVKTGDQLVVDGGANRGVRVTGEFNTEVDGAKYSVLQGGTEKLIQQSPKTYIESADEVHIKVGPSQLVLKSDGTITVKTSSSLLLGVEGSKIELTPGGIAMESAEIQLKAGESTLKLEASKATVKGANVDVLADLFTTIKGTLVRIN